MALIFQFKFKAPGDLERAEITDSLSGRVGRNFQREFRIIGLTTGKIRNTAKKNRPAE